MNGTQGVCNKVTLRLSSAQLSTIFNALTAMDDFYYDELRRETWGTDEHRQMHGQAELIADTLAALDVQTATARAYQAAADALVKLAHTKGRETAVAMLAKFDAAKLPDVKPDQFAAFTAECEALQAA